MTPGYQKMLENCGTEGYINSRLHGTVCFQRSDLADEGSVLSPFQIHNTAQEKVGEKAELVESHTHQCTQTNTNGAVINIICSKLTFHPSSTTSISLRSPETDLLGIHRESQKEFLGAHEIEDSHFLNV